MAASPGRRLTDQQGLRSANRTATANAPSTPITSPKPHSDSRRPVRRDSTIAAGYRGEVAMTQLLGCGSFSGSARLADFDDIKERLRWARPSRSGGADAEDEVVRQRTAKLIADKEITPDEVSGGALRTRLKIH